MVNITIVNLANLAVKSFFCSKIYRLWIIIQTRDVLVRAAL